MNPEALHTGLIETLSLTMVITSVAAVEMRRLRFSICRLPLPGAPDCGSAVEFCCCQPGSVLVGRHRLRHQGDPNTLVPFPGDPRCG